MTNIDTSFDALTGAEAALRLNGFDPDRQSESICGDVFQVLRAFRDEGRQFDLVILDPPKFARNKAELDGATRGYKDINLLGLKLLAPGGLLATFSCSGLVTPDLFQKIVFGASIDAGRRAQIIAKLGQGPDHPILLTFPEGEYLKGLLCRVGVRSESMGVDRAMRRSVTGTVDGRSVGGAMSTIYERQAEYWTRDLADRAFEEEVKAGLGTLGWQLEDHTADHDHPDLGFLRQVRGKTVRAVLELKEKRQPLRGRWVELAGVPEPELLVLDEVSARKLLARAPRAFLLFHDLTRPDAPYVLFTIIDLFCMPKVRVQRSINLNDRRMKGKWLLDRRHGQTFGNLNGVFAALATYLDRRMMDDLRRLEPHGPYIGETVETL